MSKLERQPGEVRYRQRLHAKGIKVVVGREDLDVGEVLGLLEDAGDLEAGLGRVVKRSGRGAAGGALHVHVPARVENV